MFAKEIISDRRARCFHLLDQPLLLCRQTWEGDGGGRESAQGAPFLWRMSYPGRFPQPLRFPNLPAGRPQPQQLRMKAGIYSHECESQGWTSFTEASKNNDPSSHGKEDSHETASWKALLKRTKQVCPHLLVIVGGGGQIGKLLLTQGKLPFVPQRDN